MDEGGSGVGVGDGDDVTLIYTWHKYFMYLTCIVNQIWKLTRPRTTFYTIFGS